MAFCTLLFGGRVHARLVSPLTRDSPSFLLSVLILCSLGVFHPLQGACLRSSISLSLSAHIFPPFAAPARLGLVCLPLASLSLSSIAVLGGFSVVALICSIMALSLVPTSPSAGAAADDVSATAADFGDSEALLDGGVGAAKGGPNARRNGLLLCLLCGVLIGTQMVPLQYGAEVSVIISRSCADSPRSLALAGCVSMDERAFFLD